MLGHGALGEFALGETESDGAISILPASIASAEAFDSPTVTADGYAILPASIASAEAFDSPTVSLQGSQIVDAGDIASAEAFGVPLVAPEYDILPASIASAEAFGSPVVAQPATYLPVSKIIGSISVGRFKTRTDYPGAAPSLAGGSIEWDDLTPILWDDSTSMDWDA